MVEAIRPVFYQCAGNLAKEVVASFFRTGPSTAIVEFDDRGSLMYIEQTASGARYQ
ncbi:MliC family protein [Pseudomonas sp. RL_5y_Pfl2_70]|uniref:MliC family protein n=1 Tax=Pseudomonas sp. RL_5y_Pfl2_70 TaxID=3088712 RepID=UPI0030DA1BD5